MRNLASIQRITDIRPIEGADAIEVVDVLGWHCVVAKKDNFQIGQFVVYIEVDSIVPERPEFEFLRDRKFRIKTIKLRGQISQGLVLPMSILPSNVNLWKVGLEGSDVTELLGVTKYETASEKEENATVIQSKNIFQKFLMRYKWYRKHFANKPKGGFPSFISKTDEERIQSNPKILEIYKGLPFVVTEKLEGQSATYVLKRVKSPFYFGKKYEFMVCSRTQRKMKDDGSNWWKIAKQLDIEKKLEKIIFGYDFVALQGEIIGSGIQGNIYGISGLDFYGYNLIYPNVGKVSDIALRASLDVVNLKVVPFLHVQELPHFIDTLVEISKGESALKKGQQREGIVVRNYENNISFKVVNPNYLLKSNR